MILSDGCLGGQLLEAYRQSIEKLEWMGADTRRWALDKLEKFTPKIGYPARWRDYCGLKIDPTDLMANVRAAHAFDLIVRNLDEFYGAFYVSPTDELWLQPTARVPFW